jgi:hypothetical protein
MSAMKAYLKKAPGLSYQLSLNSMDYVVWYKTDAETAQDLDYALIGSLFAAMKSGLDLHVEGCPVSSDLLKAIDQIQDIFHVWHPELKKISIQSEQISTIRTNSLSKGVGTFFTAGVDSFYTFLKHQDEITHLIYVLGFDITLEERDFFEKVKAALKEIAAVFGKEIIFIETNLRDLLDPHLRWGHSHGAALAGIAHLLKPILHKAYIPSSHGYRDLFPWGSHPLVDPLWSSHDVTIIHDGCEATRFEKVAAISRNEIALNRLRVCWNNPKNGSYNCNRCEKCARTMTSLEILGALTHAKSFTGPLNLASLRRMKHDQNSISFLNENIEAINKVPGKEALKEALLDAKAGLYQQGVRGWGKRGVKLIKRKFKEVIT